jgi:hypothetical protein
MECKQCSKNLAGEEYKMVAEWPFCPDCFRKLMEKPAEKDRVEAKSEEEVKDVVVEVGAVTAKSRCQLCDKEIEGDQYKKVGIWIFCPDCHLDMTPRIKPPPPPEPEEETDEAEEEASIHARLHVKYIQRVTCAGCNKRIPEGGSRDVDGELYCPDCYYALPEETRQASEEAETTEPGREEASPLEQPEVEAGPGCESCGKEISKEALQTVEGFGICRACLSSDAELAVHLARARHQKRLQRLKQDLEP